MISIEYIRSFKIGEYSIFDLAISFIGVFLLSPLLSKLFRIFKIEVPLSSWMLFVIPMSIIFHLLVGKITPMTKYFIDPSGHYLLKIFIITLFILGTIKIKIIK